MRLVTLSGVLIMAALALVFAQSSQLSKKDSMLKLGRDAKFRVGDVWEYKTRQGEEGSRLTITRIDESPKLGVIVHVSVSGIHFSNCHGGGEPDNIQQMPFARRALDASVTNKVASHQLLPADYDSIYEAWRSAFVKNEAGIYTIDVAEAVSAAEATFRQGIGCSDR
jgi:hypothetical protein